MNPDVGAVVDLRTTSSGIKNLLSSDRPTHEMSGGGELDATIGDGSGVIELTVDLGYGSSCSRADRRQPTKRLNSPPQNFERCPTRTRRGRRGRRRPSIAFAPRKRSGSGSQRRALIVDPRQFGQRGGAAGDQIGHGAAGQVRRRDAFADIAAGPAGACIRGPIARTGANAAARPSGRPSRG